MSTLNKNLVDISQLVIIVPAVGEIKRLDLCILILGSYGYQKPFSYKNLVFGTICQKLLKTKLLKQVFA